MTMCHITSVICNNFLSLCKQHGEKQKRIECWCQRSYCVTLLLRNSPSWDIRKIKHSQDYNNRCDDRFRKRGNVENIQRLGAPAKLSRRDNCAILRSAKINRKRSLSDITSVFNHDREATVWKRTVQRKLYSEGYHRRVVRKRIRIREVNRKNRLNWCRGNIYKTLDNYWKRVIVSDECQVDVGTNNRVFVWRKVGEDWHPCCLATPPTPKFSLMICGCITYNGVGTIIVVDGHMNDQKYIETLEDYLWPVIVCHFPNEDYIYQDDNAPIHRACVVDNYKVQNNIYAMVWPAQSPDLNIIENVWWRLKHELRNHPERLRSKANLETAIRDVWTNIPLNYIQNLYSSIPRRIHRVLMSKGYITKY